ncbi:RHS domain-containing protein [Morganella morganii]|nr:RHS domain-containing protein [Morganella morganii]
MLYVYEDSDSYSPLARIDFHHGKEDICYYRTQPNGLPDSLHDEQGETLWEARFTSWGRAEVELGTLHYLTPQRDQNLRFQGQYLDRETGLHYNTFRYYDPDTGRFTQQDPIGLAGGLNLHQYAPNPLVWVDPWGLKCTHSANNPKQAHAAIKDKWGHSMSKRDMRELQNTVDRIKLNKPHYSNDGTTFSNSHSIGNPNSQRLNTGSGPYKEWTVKTRDLGGEWRKAYSS